MILASCDNLPVHPRHLLIVLVLVVVSVAAAGCGGGAKTYSGDKTRACLAKAKVRLVGVPAGDFVAQSAEGDALSVRFRDNLVTISFGLDRNGAERIVRGYQRFRGKNIGLEDVLKPARNAVMLWAVHPNDAYLQTIEDCLK